MELHLVGSSIGSFDIYIVSTAALAGRAGRAGPGGHPSARPALSLVLFCSSRTVERTHHGLHPHTNLMLRAFFFHEHILTVR